MTSTPSRRLEGLLRRVIHASATSILPIHSIVLYESVCMLQPLGWEAQGYTLLLHALSRSMIASRGVRDRCFMEIRVTLDRHPHALLCSTRLDHIVIPFARWLREARLIDSGHDLKQLQRSENASRRRSAEADRMLLHETLDKLLQRSSRRLVPLVGSTASSAWMIAARTDHSRASSEDGGGVMAMHHWWIADPDPRCSHTDVVHLFLSVAVFLRPLLLFIGYHPTTAHPYDKKERRILLRDVGVVALGSTTATTTDIPNLIMTMSDLPRAPSRVVVHSDASFANPEKRERTEQLVRQWLRFEEAGAVPIEWRRWQVPTEVFCRPLRGGSVLTSVQNQLLPTSNSELLVDVQTYAIESSFTWNILQRVVSQLSAEIGMTPEALFPPDLLCRMTMRDSSFAAEHPSSNRWVCTGLSIRTVCHAHWEKYSAGMVPHRWRDRCVRVLTAVLVLEFPVDDDGCWAKERWARFAMIHPPSSDRRETHEGVNNSAHSVEPCVRPATHFGRHAALAKDILHRSLLCPLPSSSSHQAMISVGCKNKLIDTHDELKELMRLIRQLQHDLLDEASHLSGASCWIGLDMEFDSDTYCCEETAVLIQLSLWKSDPVRDLVTHHCTCVVDCATLTNIAVRELLQLIFSTAGVPKQLIASQRWWLLFHAHSNDWGILQRQFGVDSGHHHHSCMLDTAQMEALLVTTNHPSHLTVREEDQASGMLDSARLMERYATHVASLKRQNSPQNAGLGTLMQRYLGEATHKDKLLKFTDWLERPLSWEATAYAALDAAVLPAIAWSQLQQLLSVDRGSCGIPSVQTSENSLIRNRELRRSTPQQLAVVEAKWSPTTLEQFILDTFLSQQHRCTEGQPLIGSLEDPTDVARRLEGFLMWRYRLARDVGCAPSMILPIGEWLLLCGRHAKEESGSQKRSAFVNAVLRCVLKPLETVISDDQLSIASSELLRYSIEKIRASLTQLTHLFERDSV